MGELRGFVVGLVEWVTQSWDLEAEERDSRGPLRGSKRGVSFGVPQVLHKQGVQPKKPG